MTDRALKRDLPSLPYPGISAAAVIAFCDATGDDNPIHRDETVAHAFGLEHLVVPGMLLAGLFSRAVVHWSLDVQTDTIATRFLNPLLVDMPFAITGRIVTHDAEGRDILRLMAKHHNVIYAMGEMRLTPRR